MGAAQGKVVEIGDHKLTVQSQLKSTSKHANLYLAKDANGQLFILKRYVIRKSSKDLFARSQWESSLYQKLPNHKHLLRCFGLKRFTDKDGNCQLLSIMEFCSKGSLKKIMFKVGRSLQVLDAMHVLQNVCSALLFLHSLEPPIVHLGVRIDNIFRQTNGNWVLGDFNSSAISPVICSGQEEFRKFEQLMDVPKHYRSPEFINIRNSHCVDKASDIWALGVVFYYILFLKYPFDSDRSAILSGKYEIPQSPAYEKPVIDLLESMLQTDPESRPVIQDLYKNVDELFQHYQLMLGKNASANSRQSLLPSDAGLAHFWGHNMRPRQDLIGNPSTPTTPRGSSFSKIVADVTHWTAKALALKLVPPKAKYVRRLVILAWERQNASFSETLPGLFEFLLRQPVFNNGVAAYKSLELIHRLMQDAPPSFTSEMMQHRSFLLTIAERWQHNEIYPWLSQTLIAYALFLEHRLLFLRESFVFECNFSMTNYLVEARQEHYSGFRADFWFSRCFDVVQKMLELGLQLISCGFLAMGISGIGPTKNHLLFRESILVPVLDDLYGIFLACTFLLGIIMDCCSLHQTDVSDTKRLYDTFFSRFHALMHRASKSSLVSTPQMLPKLPKSVPELSMNSSIYPPPSNVPALTPHNVEYCEELRSQFVLLLEANTVQKGTHRYRCNQDSRSATAPSVHKFNQSNEFNLQGIFEGLMGAPDANNNNPSSSIINPALPTTSSSSPTSPVSTMKRCHSWADQGSPIRLRPKNPNNAEWNGLDFDWSCSDTVEWIPSPNSVASNNVNINIACSPSTINPKTSPFDKREIVESGDSRASSSIQTVSKKPALEITVTKDEDLNNPFAVIERSFKAQQSPRTGLSTPSSTLGVIDLRSASVTDSGFSTDASHESVDSILGEGEIPADEVKIYDRIGIGGFAEVYKGEWRGTEVAVKKLLMQKQSATSLMEFRKEVALLRNLRHPNVVMFMGACTIPPNLMMVTELLQMSLFDLLHNTNVKLTWKIRIKIALDTATGINFLHHSRIIHRDLKSANLLLDKHYGVKVSDFGLSRVKTQQVTMTGQCGTFQWMAPEVVSNEKYTEKADVYSFGIILWELAERRIPFEGMNGVQVSVAVVTQNLRPCISDDTPDEIKTLIENCWATDPKTRPPLDEIVQRLKAMQQASFINA